MRMTRAIIVVAFAIGTLMFPAELIADHAWGNYHWERSSNPFTVALGNNVDSTWAWYLSSSSEYWSASAVLDTEVVPGSTKPKPCKAKDGNVQICNAGYGFNGWLGIASISVSGDHITAGVVKLNDSYFDASTYDTPEWRQFVMCQEIGHTFGLDHQDENFDNENLGTCMDYTSDPASNQQPNDHDYAELETIYGHLDVTSGGGGSDEGGSGCNPRAPWCNGASAADILSTTEMNGPAQWGRLVSEHGPQEVYELDFGRGRKVITFVTWTPERAHNHDH